MSKMTKMTMPEIICLTKALADETRVRVLLALRLHELCACQITELFGFAPSTMSEHLFLLKQGGLVEARKEGRWIYYTLAGRQASRAVRDALAWLHRTLADDPCAAADARQLKRILKCNPGDLCKKQCQR